MGLWFRADAVTGGINIFGAFTRRQSVGIRPKNDIRRILLGLMTALFVWPYFRGQTDGRSPRVEKYPAEPPSPPICENPMDGALRRFHL